MSFLVYVFATNTYAFGSGSFIEATPSIYVDHGARPDIML